MSFAPIYSKNICMSQAITDATIKLCSESGGEQCDVFSAPKENIGQVGDGELRLSFPVHVQDQRMYNSTLCVHYESGQELHSIDSFPIGMCVYSLIALLFCY